MRDGFIIHDRTLKQMRRLPQEDAGYLMSCLTDYYNGESLDLDHIADVSLAVAVILEDAIDRMDADAKAYEKSAEQRRKAAESRWNNAKPSETDAKECDRMRDDATACESNAKNAVPVPVTDTVLKEKGILTDTQKESPAEAEPLMVAAKQIIDHLNEKAGTHYRSSSKATVELIKGRLREHWKVADFFTVIDKKCAEWKGTEQEQYLRPETLFARSHFESYLNQPDRPPNKRNVTKFSDFPARNDNAHKDMVAKVIAMQ